MNTDIYNVLRLLAKGQPGWYSNISVEIIPGRSAPKVVGRSFYYTNKRGDLIRYPSAYAKAWGKPIYHHSSLRVQVGKNFAATKTKKVVKTYNYFVAQ